MVELAIWCVALAVVLGAALVVLQLAVMLVLGVLMVIAAPLGMLVAALEEWQRARARKRAAMARPVVLPRRLARPRVPLH